MVVATGSSRGHDRCLFSPSGRVLIEFRTRDQLGRCLDAFIGRLSKAKLIGRRKRRGIGRNLQRGVAVSQPSVIDCHRNAQQQHGQCHCERYES